ncbi:MAG: hypothetical protein ABI041_16055 [Bdellovibrionia bacterium]
MPWKDVRPMERVRFIMRLLDGPAEPVELPRVAVPIAPLVIVRSNPSKYLP